MTTLVARKGQNLSQLVNQYNRTHRTKVSVGQVAKQNKLKDANKINVGQRIRIADGFDAPKTRTTTPKKTETKPTTTPTTKKTVTNQVETRPTVTPEPVKKAREQGWLEWLVTYKPFGK